jgi:hypothetical protein
MMLQEEIVFTEYFRVYCLGRSSSNTCTSQETNLILRYVLDGPPTDKKLLATVKDYENLSKGLGYDFNTVEFAVRDGILHAIDLGKPCS